MTSLEAYCILISGNIFRLSFIDVPAREQEIKNPSLCLALRLLYHYLSLLKSVDKGYPQFVSEMENTNFTLSEVLKFIQSKSGVKEQLIVLHIDETQMLITQGKQKHDGFLYKLLQELWSVINDAYSTSYLFVVLSGTNALDVYKEFLTSNYKYYPLNLPLLADVHFKEIITSVMANWKVTISENLLSFFHLATGGHPRLLSATISAASWLEAQSLGSHDPTLASKKRSFNPKGFYAFLEKMKSNPGNEILWKLLKLTWDDVSINQFPEVQNTVLAPNYAAIRQEILARIFSNQTIVARKEKFISKPEIIWGFLEDKGGVFLGNIEVGKSNDKKSNKKVSPSKIYESNLEKTDLELHVSLLFALKYFSPEMELQPEPLFDSNPTLDSDNNELQDVATIMNSLWIYKYQNPDLKGIDLADSLHIPGLKHKTFIVNDPINYKVEPLRWTVTTTGQAAELRNKLEEEIKVESIDLQRKKPFCAFTNGAKAAWGDGFIFLRLFQSDKWLCLIVQSKRKAVNFMKKDKQLQADLDKVFGKQESFDKYNMSCLYLYVTDSSVVEQPTTHRDNVYVIARDDQERFYGAYRAKLKRLRDLPPPPKSVELDKQRKKEKELKQELGYCECKSQCKKGCPCNQTRGYCEKGSCHPTNGKCSILKDKKPGNKRTADYEPSNKQYLAKKQRIIEGGDSES